MALLYMDITTMSMAKEYLAKVYMVLACTAAAATKTVCLETAAAAMVCMAKVTLALVCLATATDSTAYMAQVTMALVSLVAAQNSLVYLEIASTRTVWKVIH